MISEDLRHTAETDMDEDGHPTDEHVVLVDLVTVFEGDIRPIVTVSTLRHASGHSSASTIANDTCPSNTSHPLLLSDLKILHILRSTSFIEPHQ